MRIGDQPCYQVDHEVVHTAMAAVFDLADIFELVVDGFNERPLTEQDLVYQRHETVDHALA